MPLWSALAQFNLGQWLPHPPAVHGRKSKLAKSYKPAPLITPFQKYTKQERNSWVSETASQYSSSSSSSSSSSTAPDDLDSTPPLGFFEPQGEVLVPENVRLRMEFAQLRLRPHWHGGRPVQNVFDHPRVRRRLERQRRHDRASLALLPTQAPPIFYSNPLALAPCASPAPVRESSYIVQKWHGLKKEADAVREDCQVYAQIRSREVNSTPAVAAICWR